MEKDKELSTNDEVKRDEKHQDTVNDKSTIVEMIKELLVSSTESVFSKAGYDKNETYAGVYGDGTKYGAGAKENQFSIKLAGKTNENIDKIITLGAKRLESQINLIFKDTTFVIEYRTKEAAFFRGVDKETGKTYMLNDKKTFATDEVKKNKKEITDMFEENAKKELEYIKNTKIGVEDKESVGTTSTVENIETFTLKEFFDHIGEVKNTPSLEDTESENIDKLVDLNTIPLADVVKSKDTKGLKNRFLLFDDKIKEIQEEMTEEEKMHINEKLSGLNHDEYVDFFKKTMLHKFQTDKLSDLSQEQKRELFKSVDSEYKSKEELAENNVAEGNDWESIKKMIEDRAKKLNWSKEETEEVMNAEKDAFDKKEISENNINENGDWESVKKTIEDRAKKLNRSKEETEEVMNAEKQAFDNKEISEITTSGPAGASGFQTGAGGYLTKYAFQKTNYAKQKGSKKPKIDKNYNIIPEGKKKDSFYTTVKIDPNYHPLGMPFIKPGSQEELDRTMYGDKDKMKRMGIAESVSEVNNSVKKTDLTRKKFFSKEENEKGKINKRYLVTEKTSEQYLKERWEKLSQFKVYESIEKREENLINEVDSINEIVDVIPNIGNLPINEETMSVKKPGSFFGLEYKFYKKDYLNEAKKYILDLNSMTFVENPNSVKK